jgi:HEAT repeats
MVWTPGDSRKGAVMIQNKMLQKLPDSPSLEHLRNQAKALLEAFRTGDANAVQRVRAVSSAEPFKLSHAQFVIAREYGFHTWMRLKARVERPIKISRRQQFVRDLANELLTLASSDVVALAARMAIPLRDILDVRTHLLETKRLHFLVDGLLLGLEHERPKVRADCAGALDHFADERCAEPLTRLLSDPVPKVRRTALHSLSCDVCKPVPLEVTGDLVARLIEMTLHDSSIRVRRAALENLGASCADPRALQTLEQVVSSESDVEMVRRAKRTLAISSQP